jgi:hypothetical protein
VKEKEEFGRMGEEIKYGVEKIKSSGDSNEW